LPASFRSLVGAVPNRDSLPIRSHPARHSRPKPSAFPPTRCVHVLPTLDRSAAAALSEEYAALLKEEEELDAMLKEVRRGLAPQPTSAPGPGSRLLHLHRDRARRYHICTAAGCTPAIFTSAASLGRIFRVVDRSSGRLGPCGMGVNRTAFNWSARTSRITRVRGHSSAALACVHCRRSTRGSASWSS
jgi:hypothetical protein